MTQALQEIDMTLRQGRNSTSFLPAWNHGKTQTIRVPIALAPQILDYARTVDATLAENKPETIPEHLQGDFLQLIDRYIEYKRENYHPNQHSRELDINTRPWDELRKFRAMVKSSYGIFDKTTVAQPRC